MNKTVAVSLLCVVLFLAGHFVLGTKAIQINAPTYDEPVHLTAGYVYFKTGQFDYNGLHHPAFSEMWAAFPLVFLKPFFPRFHPAWRAQTWKPLDQYQFADFFLYKNRISHEILLNRGRLMQLVLSSLLGLFLFTGGLLLAGWASGVLALGFCAFSPTILAHGTLVTTDLAFAVFYFCFFLSLMFWRTPFGPVAAGLSAGLCFASKYLAVAMGPSLVLLVVWRHFSKSGRVELNRTQAIKMGLALISGALVILGVYQFKEVGVFFEGLMKIVTRAQTGRSSFFWGEHGTQGWLHYFPTLFLTKTTVPVLLGLILIVAVPAARKKMSPFFVIPPLVLFGLACVSSVQIGHRHILGVYPFVFILLGLGLPALPGKARFLGVGLLGWSIVNAWAVQPYFLPYFNELAGGPAQGYRLATDSNVDWGQGLKELGQQLDEADKENGIYLSYFGVADPRAYGISYIDVGSDMIVRRRDHRFEKKLSPTKLAISVTNYQSTYYVNKKAFAWLHNRTPQAQLGHSIFLYDFANDPEAMAILKRMSGFDPQA